nr:nucleotidyltransferase family protein [Deinobacterium chartae]
MFGSFAYDRARGDSDIDLLVEFERETGYFGLVRLRTRLEDLLGRRVDIVTPAALKGPIRQRILEAVIYVE